MSILSGAAGTFAAQSKDATLGKGPHPSTAAQNRASAQDANGKNFYCSVNLLI
jgi:hypothetical protein